MQTVVDDKKENQRERKLAMTEHFIERYHERVLYKKPPVQVHHKKMRQTILQDIDRRLQDRQKTALEVFSGSNNAKLPFGGCYLLIVKKHTLITVLN